MTSWQGHVKGELFLFLVLRLKALQKYPIRILVQSPSFQPPFQARSSATVRCENTNLLRGMSKP